jgi:hypothetical protein
MENLSLKIGDFTLKPCHVITFAIGALVVYLIMKRAMSKCKERETTVKKNLEAFLSSDYAQGLGVDAKRISAQVFDLK